MSVTPGPPELLSGALDPKETFRYRILRYAPNVERDEWVNIGVMLEDFASGRLAVRLIEHGTEFARVRRIHPDADQDLLRALPQEFKERLRGTRVEVTTYLEKLNQSLSNAIQLSPQRALLAENFDAEMDRLYQTHVTPPARHGGVIENLRDMMRAKLRDVFRRHRVLGKMKSNVKAEGFTYPGDPMEFDFGYQNGVRGFVQLVSLKRDNGQVKSLAYTAGRVRERDAAVEIAAVTEIPPQPDNRRHRFFEEILNEQKIRIVPMSQVERFAEELRVRLN